MFDPERYRDKAEVAHGWNATRSRCCARRWRPQASSAEAQWRQLEADAAAEVAAGVDFAEAGTPEPLEDLTRFVYSEPGTPGRRGRADEIQLPEALRAGIRDALTCHDRVFLMGEDVGADGGSFAVSLGLAGGVRAGADPGHPAVRVRVRRRRHRRRPRRDASSIAEIMTVNFSLLALDQLVNNAASLLHMSGGQFHVPLVVRMTTGAGRQLGAQHSHSLEGGTPTSRAADPGPATLEDALRTLWTALQDPDPVLIFEHGSLYNVPGELADDAGPVDIATAAIRRPGNDVSLITYGGTLPLTLEAAGRLAAEGIDAEVLDLATRRPLDDAAILASVAKTHRAVVVDEGWRSGSISAEISARISEHAFFDLGRPGGPRVHAEVPIPYSKHLELAALPSAAPGAAAAREAVGARG